MKQRKGFSLFLVALFFASFLVTGCGSADQTNSKPDPVVEQSMPTVGTNGQLIPIESNNVSAAGYDESTMIMTVRFDSGGLYEYYGVPAELWTSFIAAQPDPWSQVGYPRLVQGGVQYKRIG